MIEIVAIVVPILVVAKVLEVQEASRDLQVLVFLDHKDLLEPLALQELRVQQVHKVQRDLQEVY
jgi:hypothetical protein